MFKLLKKIFYGLAIFGLAYNGLEKAVDVSDKAIEEIRKNNKKSSKK